MSRSEKSASELGESAADFGSGARSRTLIAGATIALVALGGYLAVVPVFRQYLLEYLGIGDREFGLMFGLAAAAALVPALFAGWLADSWGARRVVRWSLVGCAVSLGLLAISGAWWIVMAGALALNRLFSVPLDLAANTFLVHLYPNRTRRIVSLNLAVRSASEMVVTTLCECWLKLVQALPAVSFAVVLHVPFAALAAVFAAGSFLYRGSENLPRLRWSWRSLRLSRRSGALVALMALHGAADGTLFTWMPRYLGGPSFTETGFLKPGMVLSAFSLAYLVSRLGLAGVPEGSGRRLLMVAPGLVGGTLAIAGFLSGRYNWAALGYVVGGLCWSLEYPMMVSVMAEVERERFGSALAVASLATAALGALAVSLAGQAVALLGPERMTGVMVALAGGFPIVGAGGALWLALGHRGGHC